MVKEDAYSVYTATLFVLLNLHLCLSLCDACRQLSYGTRPAVQHVSGTETQQDQNTGRHVQQPDAASQLRSSQGDYGC